MIINRNGQHVHHGRKKVCIVRISIKRIICFIVITYYYSRKLQSGVWLIKKVGVEELDVLREQYKRPARSLNTFGTFLRLITFVRGRPDDQVLNNAWRLNVSCFTNIHVFFCFSSFSLSLDYRITQATVIAEFLEGKRLKLLYSKCTQCRLLVRSIFQHQFNLCERNTKRIWLRITINPFCSHCLLIVKFEGQSINLIMKLMASIPGDTFFQRKR